MITVLSYLLLALIFIVQAPFSTMGYVYAFIEAFLYFGYSRANEHQDYLIKLSETRKANKETPRG